MLQTPHTVTLPCAPATSQTHSDPGTHPCETHCRACPANTSCSVKQTKITSTLRQRQPPSSPGASRQFCSPAPAGPARVPAPSPSPPQRRSLPAARAPSRRAHLLPANRGTVSGRSGAAPRPSALPVPCSAPGLRRGSGRSLPPAGASPRPASPRPGPGPGRAPHPAAPRNHPPAAPRLPPLLLPEAAGSAWARRKRPSSVPAASAGAASCRCRLSAGGGGRAAPRHRPLPLPDPRPSRCPSLRAA